MKLTKWAWMIWWLISIAFIFRLWFEYKQDFTVLGIIFWALTAIYITVSYSSKTHKSTQR